MKLAVTATGTDLDAPVDPRFGRAQYILIVDGETLDVEVLDNSENVNALKGAGIQAATTIGNKGVSVLITGFCGPNAFKTLEAANVQVAADAQGTVREAVKAFMDGDLPVVDEPNAQGQW
jgi:predicted Fe-Mo cluster-binding NifX family protein